MILFTETEEETEKALADFYKDIYRRGIPSEKEQSLGKENSQVLASKKKLRKIVRTSCGHLFHENCLDKWLKSKKECPYCRKGIVDMLKQE